MIPYTLPGEDRVREWRLRRDRPEMEYRRGKLRERGKYLSPPGRANLVYYPPGMPPDFLPAVKFPVIVTEGEFKTLALWRLALLDSEAPRFLPLGLSGVWNWRGTIGKTTGPNGDRRDVKGVVPDLDLVTWEGRRAIIAFDADAENNEQVETARSLLARELRLRGAQVAIVTWDIAKGKGIDDLLAAVGPEEVLALLDGADFDKEESGENISVPQIAEAITSRHRFARDNGGRLHVFRSGSYHPDGTALVRQKVKHILQRLRLASKWSSHKAEEVLKYIEVDAPVLWERPRLAARGKNSCFDVRVTEMRTRSGMIERRHYLPIGYS